MRHRGGVVALVLAILFGLLGGATTLIYLRQAGATHGPAIATTPVVVTTSDITFGTVLSPDHVKVVNYPKDSVPLGAYSSPDSLVGQTTKVFLNAREPVLATKLSSIGGGLSVRIPVNMRATSMNVNVVSGVSGFVLPGDRVDVLVVIDRTMQQKDAVTRTILQNIEVLAAGQKTEQKGDDPIKVQSVTLLVDPEGAERLALALHEGKLHLVLRNPADHQIAQVEALSTSEILGEKAKPAPKPVVRRREPPKPAPVVQAPPEKQTVTAIKGVKVEEQEPAMQPKTNTKSD